MHKLELERLLERTVADALGVALPDEPDEPDRRVSAKLPRQALPRRAKTLAAHPRHHHRAAQHA